MKAIRLGLALTSGLCLVTNVYSANNPASMRWVIDYVAAQFASTSVGLTDADWALLCPNNTISTGCLPDCQNAQAAACQAVLKSTSAQNYLNVTLAAENGMYVQGFTPTASSSLLGPEITNGNTDNNIVCGLFSSSGNYVPQIATLTGPGGPVITSYTTPSILFTNTVGNYSAASLGFLPSNTPFYLLCFGFTVNGNLSTNASAVNVSASW